MSSRLESVGTPDGTFDLHVWLPSAGSGPGLLLIQEIYGVSDYMQAVADDFGGLMMGGIHGDDEVFLSPRWGLTVCCDRPTASAVGCILSPLRS